MASVRDLVTVNLVAQYVGETVRSGRRGGGSVVVNLCFDPQEPLEIVAVFDPYGDTAEWTLSRELLIEGMTAPAGHGDVAIHRAGVVVYLRLYSPDGVAVVTLPAGTVQRFISRTLRTVPRSREQALVDADVDAALTRILEES